MRLVTYNIHQGEDTTAFDMSELSDAIANAKADVICIQEARENDASYGSINMLDQIRANLGMDGYVFGLNWDSTLGNGIIYKGTLLESQNHALATPDDATGQIRGALRCVIRLRGNTITVISTHLSGGSQTDPAAVGAAVRRAQLSEVKAVTDTLSGPVIIAGDFNHTSVADSYSIADQYWVRASRVSPPPVLPANNQGRDHIYMQGNLTAKFTSIIDNHSATGGASDHQPVYADIGSYGLAAVSFPSSLSIGLSL